MANDRAAIWTPSADDLKRSSMAKFRDEVNQKYGLSLNTYPELHAWSVNPSTAEDFWITLFEFLHMGATVQPSRAFENHHGKMFPSPKFFPGARMNFTGSILLNRDPKAPAIYEAQEGNLDSKLFTQEMIYSHVEKIADAMRECGVGKGDRVAAVIANTELSISLCLAALSIGAIWSSISPDFGVQGILDRLVQIDAKLVFANTTVVYNGKMRNLVPTIESWAKTICQGASLENIVLTENVNTAKITKGVTLDKFLSQGSGKKLEFEQLSFCQPAFIFYSSGTTGAPKCILHSAGGVLLQIKKDYVLHIGVLPTDIIFQYTTTAWIMWAFIISAMSIGSPIVVYSGSPLYPNIKFLPKLISKLRVSVFGTSAKHLTDLMDSKTRPRDDVDLSSLRKVTSTGSVLPADVARWVYSHGFPKNIQLISGSGGTDCACAFVSGSPLLTAHADEIQCKTLGMAVDVFDPVLTTGKSIALSGEPGELVCKEPFPSQPLTFWGKNGNQKYQEAYFSMFGESVWVQGDLIRLNPTTGGIQMLGRSDGVLNPSGVRFGSAEIYNIVRLFPEIEDSVCVGRRRPQDRDESVMLFLKLKTGEKRTTALKQRLKEEIGKGLSKRHVPKYVFYVDDIPYSVVGKKLEILVKNLVSGRKVESNVVANPDSLAVYERFFRVEETALESNTQKPKL